MRRSSKQTRLVYIKPATDIVEPQSLDYRIPSNFCGAGRTSRFAMRTTDVSRSGRGGASFLHDVYVRDMAPTRIPKQLEQLLRVPSVTLRHQAGQDNKTQPGSIQKCVHYILDCCDGINAFSIVKVVADPDKVGHSWQGNAVWYSDDNLMAVKVHTPVVSYLADVHAPPGNIVGHIDKNEMGLRLLDSQENVIFQLKKESQTKNPMKCLQNASKNRFEVEDDQRKGRFGTIHYKGSKQSSIKVRFGSQLQQVERILLVGLSITLAGLDT